MQFNSKLATFLLLMIICIFVWIPKGKKIKSVSAATSSVTSEQVKSMMKAIPKERTTFTDWGRNPFVFPKKKEEKEEADGTSDLELTCIVWSNGEALALINRTILHVGDKITNKTVKQIENNRVILTDGTKDYVLILSE